MRNRTGVVMCALLLGVVTVYAEQDQSSSRGLEPSAFAGKWELGIGRWFPTTFDWVLELKVETDAKVTGTMTMGTRIVRMSGDVMNGIVRLRTDIPLDSTHAGPGTFSGELVDGRLQGSYFQTTGGLVKMGWAARRPVTPTQ